MASSNTTKVPIVNSVSESTRQFNSLDSILSIDDDSTSETQETNTELQREIDAERRVRALKSCLGGWRLAGGVLGVMMVLGWMCIIAVLILEEKWQLVLIAWLLLYAAAHFCYWYFKRHSLLSLNSRLRDRLVQMGNNGEKPNDHPPSYDDVIKSEPPPPAYYSVVEESPKGLDRLKIALKSTGAIPKVFKMRSSSNSSENLQIEESSNRKSSSRLDERIDNNSLFIIDEHLAPNSSRYYLPHPLTSSRGPLPITDIISPSLDVLSLEPPSYDSIIFSHEQIYVENSQTKDNRNLSTIAVDINLQNQ